MSADPFGLWQADARAETGESPGGLAYSTGTPEQASAVVRWEVNLDQGEAALSGRAERINALSAGSAEAELRLGALLRGPASYAAASGPESDLLAGLASLKAPAEYGLATSVDWAALAAGFGAFRDLVNHQLLHYLWVDTLADGRLAARTTLQWGSDTNAIFSPTLRPEQIQAHQRSLALALHSRLVNLGIFVRVTRMAAQIVLAATTPVGPVQALGLAWQFLQEILLPQLRQLERSTQPTL